MENMSLLWDSAQAEIPLEKNPHSKKRNRWPRQKFVFLLVLAWMTMALAAAAAPVPPGTIACGLLHSPRVIYFDEPLTGLDPIGIRRMKDSILKRARDGAAIIVSSHLLHLVEEICSRILILKDGQKIADGTLDEITQKFSEQPGDANLEEIFFRATSEPGATAAPPPLPR